MPRLVTTRANVQAPLTFQMPRLWISFCLILTAILKIEPPADVTHLGACLVALQTGRLVLGPPLALALVLAFGTPAFGVDFVSAGSFETDL